MPQTVIRTEMFRRGMSVRDLARAVGGNEAQVSWITAGKRACSKQLMEPIAKELGIALSDAWDSLGRARLVDGA